MSTILEALRKSRSEPPQESIEPRQEALSSRTHDYLATVSGTSHDEVRLLRSAVYGAVIIIVLLALVVVALLYHSRTADSSSLSATPRPAHVVSAPVAPTPNAPPPEAPTPAALPAAAPVVEGPIQLTAATPMVAPTEAPLPPPAPIPTMVAPEVESEEALLARAAELRAQAVETPRPAPRRIEAEEDSGSVRDIRISGIVWDSQSPVAMVDGKIVKPGSIIRGAKVVQINKDSLVLETDGRQVTVRQ